MRAWFGDLRMAHVVGSLLLAPSACGRADQLHQQPIRPALCIFRTSRALWAFTESQHRRMAKVLSAFICALLVKSVAIVLPALCAVGMARGERVHWERARGPLVGMGAVALLYIGLITANRFLPSSFRKGASGSGCPYLDSNKSLDVCYWGCDYARKPECRSPLYRVE